MKKDANVLKSQKMEFEDRILIMTHQLKQSKALVDKLSADLKTKPALNTTSDPMNNEWTSLKLSYENQIIDLRKAIAKYSSYVSQEEYARTKNECEMNASILSEKVKEINSLMLKVKDLEDRLKRSDESITTLAKDTKPTLNIDTQPTALCNDVNVSVQPVTPSNDVNITIPSVVQSKESIKQLISPTFLKTKTRREVILAASNMKKIRSPLASIQDNGRALAIRLATSHGKENVTCQ